MLLEFLCIGSFSLLWVLDCALCDLNFILISWWDLRFMSWCIFSFLIWIDFDDRFSFDYNSLLVLSNKVTLICILAVHNPVCTFVFNYWQYNLFWCHVGGDRLVFPLFIYFCPWVMGGKYWFTFNCTVEGNFLHFFIWNMRWSTFYHCFGLASCLSFL